MKAPALVPVLLLFTLALGAVCYGAATLRDKMLWADAVTFGEIEDKES